MVSHLGFIFRWSVSIPDMEIELTGLSSWFRNLITVVSKPTLNAGLLTYSTKCLSRLAMANWIGSIRNYTAQKTNYNYVRLLKFSLLSTILGHNLKFAFMQYSVKKSFLFIFATFSFYKETYRVDKFFWFFLLKALEYGLLEDIQCLATIISKEPL